MKTLDIATSGSVDCFVHFRQEHASYATPDATVSELSLHVDAAPASRCGHRQLIVVVDPRGIEPIRVKLTIGCEPHDLRNVAIKVNGMSVTPTTTARGDGMRTDLFLHVTPDSSDPLTIEYVFDAPLNVFAVPTATGAAYFTVSEFLVTDRPAAASSIALTLPASMKWVKSSPRGSGEGRELAVGFTSLRPSEALTCSAVASDA